MSLSLDETHDARRTSWVDSANSDATDFPIQNLPFGAFRKGAGDVRLGVAIGDSILDLRRCWEERGPGGELEGAFTGLAAEALEACQTEVLNPLMALGPAAWRALRVALSRALRADGVRTEKAARSTGLLVARTGESVTMELAVSVGDYTDFYCSLHHATNVGSLFRPDNPLLPNYKHLPVGYHGRSSSLIASGRPVRRPRGQVVAAGEAAPRFAASRLLDYELEVGFFVGGGNALGEAIDIADAEAHIFGLCLVNDWSARDIQSWEYQPLGPFLGKSFATSLGSWIVTLDALAPFRTPEPVRHEGDPQRLAYLESEPNRQSGGIDLALEVKIGTAAMRQQGTEPSLVSASNLRDLYWTLAQMLTHHASNGCNLRTGDLIASGTVSGPEKTARGCLLELTWRGTEPIELAGGEQRTFLLDGDEVVFSGQCRRDGARQIGFGECRGEVIPAAMGRTDR